MKFPMRYHLFLIFFLILLPGVLAQDISKEKLKPVGAEIRLSTQEIQDVEPQSYDYCSSSKSASLNTQYSNYLKYGTSEKWYRFYVNGPSDLTVELDVPNGKDYDLKVYNRCGGSVECSSGNYGDDDEECTVNEADGYYYARVYSFEGYGYENFYIRANSASSSKPDLRVYDIDYPSTIYDGESFNLRYEVKNYGDGSASYFRTRFYKDGSQFHTCNFNNGLSPGLVEGCTISISLNKGIHTLMAIADFDGRVSESNENNNNDAVTVNVQSRGKPDLKPIGLLFTPTNPTEEQSFNVLYEMKNDGSVNSGATKMYLYIDGVKRHTCYFNEGLRAGYFGKCTYNSAELSSGSHNFEIRTDPSNQVDESNENNNKKSWTKTIVAVPKPDLRVYDIEHPSTIYDGESFNLRYEVKNYGTVKSDPFTAAFYLNGGVVNYCNFNNGLAPNSVEGCTISLNLDNGYYSFMAGADYNNKIEESNEDNNFRTEYVDVIEREKPDLVPAPITLTPLRPKENEPFKLVYGVKNIGNVQANGPFVIPLKFSSGSFSKIYKCNENVGVAPGETRVCTFYNVQLSQGSYEVKVTVDSNNQIDESQEGNNEITQSLMVDANEKADLNIQDISVLTDPYENSEFKLKYVIGNGGTNTAYDFINSLSINGDQKGTCLISSLSPNDAYDCYVWPVAIPGTHEMLARADISNQVDEEIESNNGWIKDLKILPDLEAHGLVTRPSSPAENSQFTFEYRTTNDGWATANNPRVNAYIFDSSGRQVKESLCSYSSLAPKMTLICSSITTLTAGQYTLKVYADEHNDMPELDESDNLAQLSFTVGQAKKIDLYPDNLRTIPDNLVSDSAFAFKFNVKNQYSTSVSPFLVDIYVDGKKEFFCNFENGLGVNQYGTCTFDPLYSPAGKFNVYVSVDPDNAITEVSDNNNFADLEKTVQQEYSKSDLIVEDIQSKNDRIAGSQGDFIITVKNNGGISSISKLGVFVDNKFFASINTPMISKDQTVQLPIEIKDVSVGIHSIKASANYKKSFSEETFSNNNLTKSYYWSQVNLGYCGDGLCNNDETASSCPIDCVIKKQLTISVKKDYTTSISQALVQINSKNQRTDSFGETSFILPQTTSYSVKASCPDNSNSKTESVFLSSSNKRHTIYLNCNPSNDLDGDGYENDDEILMGTDPNNEQSNLKNSFSKLESCSSCTSLFPFASGIFDIDLQDGLLESFETTGVIDQPNYYPTITLGQIAAEGENIKAAKHGTNIVISVYDEESGITAFFYISPMCQGFFSGVPLGIGEGFVDDVKGVVQGLKLIVDFAKDLPNAFQNLWKLLSGLWDFISNVGDILYDTSIHIFELGQSSLKFLGYDVNELSRQEYHDYQMGFMTGYYSGYVSEQVFLFSIAWTKAAKLMKAGIGATKFGNYLGKLTNLIGKRAVKILEKSSVLERAGKWASSDAIKGMGRYTDFVKRSDLVEEVFKTSDNAELLFKRYEQIARKIEMLGFSDLARKLDINQLDRLEKILSHTRYSESSFRRLLFAMGDDFDKLQYIEKYFDIPGLDIVDAERVINHIDELKQTFGAKEIDMVVQTQQGYHFVGRLGEVKKISLNDLALRNIPEKAFDLRTVDGIENTLQDIIKNNVGAPFEIESAHLFKNSIGYELEFMSKKMKIGKEIKGEVDSFISKGSTKYLVEVKNMNWNVNGRIHRINRDSLRKQVKKYAQWSKGNEFPELKDSIVSVRSKKLIPLSEVKYLKSQGLKKIFFTADELESLKKVNKYWYDQVNDLGMIEVIK